MCPYRFNNFSHISLVPFDEVNIRHISSVIIRAFFVKFLFTISQLLGEEIQIENGKYAKTTIKTNRSIIQTPIILYCMLYVVNGFGA